MISLLSLSAGIAIVCMPQRMELRKMHSKSVFYALRSMLYKQEKNAAPRGRQKLRTRVKKKRILRHVARCTRR
jgi:hypothetical protein